MGRHAWFFGIVALTAIATAGCGIPLAERATSDTVGPMGSETMVNDTQSSNPGPTTGESPAIAEPFSSPIGLPVGIVTIGSHPFHVEVAETDPSREQGLMERESLAADAGMLFVFDTPEFLAFWMFNTPSPLDVAFIREDLTISSIETMEPLSTNLTRSIEPILFALEVNAGQFALRGIGPGASVRIDR